MPIVDVELVCESEVEFNAVSSRAIANAVGSVFHSPPGRTWVRLRFVNSAHYAENNVSVSNEELPVFVTVLHARPPVAAALAAEVSALTTIVAQVIGRPAERVHVQYAPAAVGRQAFGGQLVE
jgi:phenylpyruvate tautomerase PptA (4-oxalocrotonate tautomerase family)